jgi:hypothetical protein
MNVMRVSDTTVVLIERVMERVTNFARYPQCRYSQLIWF